MSNPITPITEDDIANFLVNTPDFFERHAELLATVRLTSPHGQRAVSLQERQAEMMRDKIRVLELRMMDMMRHGTENQVLVERLQHWVKTLLMTNNARDLPHTIADRIAHDFMVPQVALKVWQVNEALGGWAYKSGLRKVYTLVSDFGPGHDGEAVLDLVDYVDAPLISVLHTVTPAPSANQRRSFLKHWSLVPHLES